MKIADLTERAIGQAARWIWRLVTAGLGIASTDQANVEQIQCTIWENLRDRNCIYRWGSAE